MALIPRPPDRRPLTSTGDLVQAFCPDCQATVLVETIEMDADTSSTHDWSWDPAFTYPIVLQRRYQLSHWNGEHSWTSDGFTVRRVTRLKVITR